VFERLTTTDSRRPITVEIDGVRVSCFDGDTVAAVVLLHGRRPYRRSVITGSGRAPFCMMGICFECLVEIDGVPNQQGCLRKVEPDMRIRRQLAVRAVADPRTVKPDG
jgi:hypothetical protein